jgi:hypothetical protein
MDLSVAPNCGCRCYLTFFHFPERSIALVKRLAGSPKELKLIRTCPTLTKVLLQGSTRLITLMDPFSHQTVQAVAILPSSIFRTFNCTSKNDWLVHQGAEIDPNLPTLTKVLQGSTRILIYIDGSFSRTKCGCRCYLTFFHFPERSIALKRLAGSPKELKLIPTCPITNAAR